MPRCRRRQAPPPRHRVLPRIAAPTGAGPHPPVHDLHAAHGPWRPPPRARRGDGDGARLARLVPVAGGGGLGRACRARSTWIAPARRTVQRSRQILAGAAIGTGRKRSAALACTRTPLSPARARRVRCVGGHLSPVAGLPRLDGPRAPVSCPLGEGTLRCAYRARATSHRSALLAGSCFAGAAGPTRGRAPWRPFSPAGVTSRCALRRPSSVSAPRRRDVGRSCTERPQHGALSRTRRNTDCAICGLTRDCLQQFVSCPVLSIARSQSLEALASPSLGSRRAVSPCSGGLWPLLRSCTTPRVTPGRPMRRRIGS